MTFISSRAPLLFGAAGCGVCGCLEAASYYYWRDSKTERRGALLELAASTGNSVAGGICTALAARTVLSRSWVQDALTVRYTEAPTIFRKAGGRIGARASIYFLAATVVSSVTSSWVGGDHLPLAPLLPSLPVIILFWLPGWMPVLAPAYVGGSVFGLMVGNRARVEILSRGGGLDAAAAVLRPGYPYTWSFLVRVQLSTVAFIMSLPKAILRLSLSPSDFSSGGDGGGSGSSYSWQWERRWAIDGSNNGGIAGSESNDRTGRHVLPEEGLNGNGGNANDDKDEDEEDGGSEAEGGAVQI